MGLEKQLIYFAWPNKNIKSGDRNRKQYSYICTCSKESSFKDIIVAHLNILIIIDVYSLNVHILGTKRMCVN